MSDPGVTAIRIRRGDVVFHVHGDNAGAEGVYLAKGQVRGIYDAPVKTTYKAGAFQVGSTYKARRYLHRDMTLGFHIIDTATSYELNESQFRQIFDYQDDLWDIDPVVTTIEVQTILSGLRRLDVLMYEQPDFEADIDPQQQQYGNLILKLRAAQPFWYEYDPDTDDEYETSFNDSASSSSGVIEVENPTDQPMLQKLILTPATWTIPDNQWVGDKGLREPGGPNGERSLSGIVVSDVNGGVVVDWDRQNLMFRDSNDTNMLGQMAGKFVNYEIPPYTPATGLSISYSGAPTGGAMARMVQPRRWSRPWGLEYEVETIETALTRFVAVGAYRYEIPDWCDTLDIVLLGGGGGGDGGAIEGITGYSNGGAAGEWEDATVERGVDIPWETTIISGVVGAGGRGGQPKLLILDNQGDDGGNTTATATGMTTLTATGGGGGGYTGHDIGEGSGIHPFNGQLYRGGTDVTSYRHNGTTPGGGAAIGRLLEWGGNGAGGAVWIRAYRVGSGS